MGCLVSKQSNPSKASAQNSTASPVTQEAENHESLAQHGHKPSAIIPTTHGNTGLISPSAASQILEDEDNGNATSTIEKPHDVTGLTQDDALKGSKPADNAPSEDVPKTFDPAVEHVQSSASALDKVLFDLSVKVAVTKDTVEVSTNAKEGVENQNPGNADTTPKRDSPRDALGSLYDGTKEGGVGPNRGASEEGYEMLLPFIERRSSTNADVEAHLRASAREVEDELVSGTEEGKTDDLRCAASWGEHATPDSLDDDGVKLNETRGRSKASATDPPIKGAVHSAGSAGEKEVKMLPEALVEGGSGINDETASERPITDERNLAYKELALRNELIELEMQREPLVNQDAHDPHREDVCPAMISRDDEPVILTTVIQGCNENAHATQVHEKSDEVGNLGVIPPGRIEAGKLDVSHELLDVAQSPDIGRHASGAESKTDVEQQGEEVFGVEPLIHGTAARYLDGGRPLPDRNFNDAREDEACLVTESPEAGVADIPTDMQSDSVFPGSETPLGGDCHVPVHDSENSQASDVEKLVVQNNEETEDASNETRAHGQGHSQKSNDYNEEPTEAFGNDEGDVLDAAVEKEAAVHTAGSHSTDVSTTSPHAHSSSTAVEQQLISIQSRISMQMEEVPLVTDLGIASTIHTQNLEHTARKVVETAQESVVEEHIEVHVPSSFAESSAVAQENTVTGEELTGTKEVTSAQFSESQDVLNEDNSAQKPHESLLVPLDEQKNSDTYRRGHEDVEEREEDLIPSTNDTETPVNMGALQYDADFVGDSQDGTVHSANTLSEVSNSLPHQKTTTTEGEDPGHPSLLARESGSNVHASILGSQTRDSGLIEMPPSREEESQQPLAQAVTGATLLDTAAIPPVESGTRASKEQQSLGQTTASEKVHMRSKNSFLLDDSSNPSFNSSRTQSSSTLQEDAITNETPTTSGSEDEKLSNSSQGSADITSPIEQLRNLERQLNEMMQKLNIRQSASTPAASSITRSEPKAAVVQPEVWDYASIYHGQCDEYVWKNPPPRTLGSGLNAYGNRWTNLKGGGYHYANHGTDGGFYIRNSDGSSYHFSPSRGGSFRP